MKGKMKHPKKGGAVKAMRHEEAGTMGGGSKMPRKVHGVSAKARLDKKARGGKVATPSSPLSGAEPKGLPAGGKENN